MLRAVAEGVLVADVPAIIAAMPIADAQTFLRAALTDPEFDEDLRATSAARSSRWARGSWTRTSSWRRRCCGARRNPTTRWRRCERSRRASCPPTIAAWWRSCRPRRPAAFAAKYGSNKSKTNAFGKCVSQTRSELSAETADEIENAAKQCKAERKADPSAFASKYGTNANKRNAFGKCVSKTVRENETQGQS